MTPGPPPTPPRWGDEVDDSDDEQAPGGGGNNNNNTSSLLMTMGGGKLTIPPTHKSRIDSKNIQITTSYRAHPGNANQLFKTVTKSKIETVKIRECKDIETRRQWKRFGQAQLDMDAATKTTVQSKDEIFLEDPHADTDLQDEDPATAIAGNLNAFWAKQQRRQLERKYDVGTATGAPGEEAAAAGWTQVGKAPAAGMAGATGKYVTPAQRAGLAGIGGGIGAAGGMGGAAGAFKPERRTDDLNTLRVTNISDETTESDLQELFQRFGRISRVYLAKDKETMRSRGFAFVSFVDTKDAARAMEALQGYGACFKVLEYVFKRWISRLSDTLSLSIACLSLQVMVT